jgi:mutator protein MutT
MEIACPSPRLVGAALVQDGKVLLGLRAAHKSLAGRWDVPGGHVEAGENLEDALRRELAEELGIVVLCSRLHTVCLVGGVDLAIYVVTSWTGEPEIRNDEHERLSWFSLEAARALPNLADDVYRGFFLSLM